MNWFGTKKPDLTEALARIEALEDDNKRLRFEWDEWFDKFRTLAARIAKRTERLERLENAPGSSQTDDPAQMSLVDRQAKIQAEILARRSSHAVPRKG